MDNQIKFPYSVVVQGKGVVTFPDDKAYIAQGGQGFVLKKGDRAYKVYHDPKDMIPLDKIQELQCLTSIDNILGPVDVLFDAKKQTIPIGFTMPYISKTEFLCQLFNKSYKETNNITPDISALLIRRMQETVKRIHNHHILIVDMNEMNFLTDLGYTTPYFIDVDSYQTPKHKSPVIMLTIQDPKVVNYQWTEKSDWFSFAIVAFQIYTNVHPYMGSHPDFKISEWPLRMKKGISVFDKRVKLPPAFMGWDVIPKAHLDWFKAIFEKGDRSVPPMLDGAPIAAIGQVIAISSSDHFETKAVHTYSEPIRSVHFYNGYCWVTTTKGLYINDNSVPTPLSLNKKRVGLLNIVGEDPLLVVPDANLLTFLMLSGKQAGAVSYDQAMEANGNIYTIQNDKLIETQFKQAKEPIQLSKTVCNVVPATKLFKGVAVQDALGKKYLAIPFGTGMCTNIPVPELDRHRVINAKYENGVCVLITEHKTKYYRFVLCFDKNHTKYDCRKIEDTVCDLSFAVNAKGVCVMPAVDRVEVFFNNSKVMSYSDAPFDASNQMVTDGLNIYFIEGNKLYMVRSK